MKKLFFTALVAVAAIGGAFAMSGTTNAPGDVYYKINQPNGACTLIPDCYTGPGTPCTLSPSGVYYIDGCVVTPTANFR